MQYALTPEAEAELNTLLKTKDARDFIEKIETSTESLRNMVCCVAKQSADERGAPVRKADIVNSWEIVTEWGDLNIWRNEMKQAIARSEQNGD